MIRLARLAEAGVIRDLVHQAYGHYVARIGKPPGPMLDDYAARIAAGQAWVLVGTGREDGARERAEAGQVTAAAIGPIEGLLVLEHQDDALLLDNIAVAPGSQGRGHGRTLLLFAEEQARAAGYDAITLYTHALMTENQALYRRAGYQETGRLTEKGFERIYMRKRLAAAG